MNTMSAYKYHLSYNKKVISVYYIVVLAIYIFCTVLALTVKDISMHGNISLNQSVICVFAIGIACFTEPFLMLSQNGISRKTAYLGMTASIATISLFVAAVDALLSLVFSNLPLLPGTVQYVGLFESLFEEYVAASSPVVAKLVSLAFGFTINLAVMAFGYFIGAAYYRMSKAMKVAVSISVPVALFVVLPIIDFVFLNGAITNFVGKTLYTISGLSTGNPALACLTSTVTAAIFSALTYLIMRRVAIKAKG